MTEQLPLFNLAVSVAAFVVGTWAWLAGRLRGRFLRLALLVAGATLMFGSASKVDLLAEDVWTAIAAIGRLGVLSLIVLTVFDRGEPPEAAIERVQQKIVALNGPAKEEP